MNYGHFQSTGKCSLPGNFVTVHRRAASSRSFLLRTHGMKKQTLPGCFSQGKTMDETQKNIHEAIEGWLEVMAEKAEHTILRRAKMKKQ